MNEDFPRKTQVQAQSQLLAARDLVYAKSVYKSLVLYLLRTDLLTKSTTNFQNFLYLYRRADFSFPNTEFS